MAMLAALIFLSLNVFADDSVCANLLASGTYKIVMRQAGELNPEVFDGSLKSLEQFYVDLKDQEYAMPDPVFVKTRLQEFRAKVFEVGALSDEEALQFYRNNLRSLYIRVAHLWSIQEARNSVGPVMSPPVEQAIAALITQYIRPWRLTDRELMPDTAREHFRARAWMMQPWLSIAGFLVEWFAHHPDEFEARAFSKFWDERASHYHLEFEFYQRMASVLDGAHERRFCCLSTPGCVTCPNNRRWLR